VGELAGLRTDRTAYPNLDAWVRRFQVRAAYKAAIARDGSYSFASWPASAGTWQCFDGLPSQLSSLIILSVVAV
jgi:hypothetical protein